VPRGTTVRISATASRSNHATAVPPPIFIALLRRDHTAHLARAIARRWLYVRRSASAIIFCEIFRDGALRGFRVWPGRSLQRRTLRRAALRERTAKAAWDAHLGPLVSRQYLRAGAAASCTRATSDVALLFTRHGSMYAERTNEVDYSGAPAPVRQDLVEVQRFLLNHLRSPGTWWTG